MAKKRVGKIDTSTMLLVGGAAVALLLLTKKSTPTVPTYVTIPSGGGSGISSGQYVTIGTSLINALDDIFG
jgi:hypothetical protein